jgi:hypothetical protein
MIVETLAVVTVKWVAKAVTNLTRNPETPAREIQSQSLRAVLEQRGYVILFYY